MTEIRKGVKEDFLEQLFVDYGNRKKNSIIYKFYSRENDRYLEEILENPLKAEKAGLKSLLYAEYRFRKQELSCYDFLQEMFTDLGENSTLYRALIARPHYQRDEEELSNKDREELSKNDWARILFLITPYLILFLGMESAEIGKLNKTTLQGMLLEMGERMQREDLRERLDSEGVEPGEVQRLFDFLIDRYLHAAVQRHFYDSGFFSIPEKEENVRTEINKAQSGGHRAKRVDKTLQLLELFCEEKGIERLAEGTGAKASDKQALELFKILLRMGRSSNTEDADNYKRLFIPLFIDEVTGISLCIVGKRYYEDYINRDGNYLKKKFLMSTYPFALAILEFTNLSLNPEIPAQTAYECAECFTYEMFCKTGNERQPEEYFEVMYGKYLGAVEDGKNLILDENALEAVPAEIYDIYFYRDYFSRGEEMEEEAGSREYV